MLFEISVTFIRIQITISWNQCSNGWTTMDDTMVVGQFRRIPMPRHFRIILWSHLNGWDRRLFEVMMAIIESFNCRTLYRSPAYATHLARRCQTTPEHVTEFFKWSISSVLCVCTWFTVGEISFENSLCRLPTNHLNQFSHMFGCSTLALVSVKRQNDTSMEKLCINLFLNKMFIWTRHRWIAGKKIVHFG